MTVATAQKAATALPKQTPHPALSRVLAKLLTGTAISVSFIGDSGLEGNTVTTPGTDDAASRFCTTLASRFGATVTKHNRAVSGYTAAYAMDPTLLSPTAWANALGDRADLYVIAFGHNDTRSDQVTSQYLPGNGYPLAASRAAVEHMIRRIRLDVPEADIIVSDEWPYTGGATSANPSLQAHSASMRRIAAAYGCAWVGFYEALVALGVGAGRDDTYIWPTGASGGNASPQHPNDAGHRVWANLFLALLPRTTDTVVVSPPMVPATAVFGAERYTHNSSWLTMPVFAGTVIPGRWRAIGTWTSSSTTPTTSSTASSQIEVQAIGTEIMLRLDSNAGQGTVKVEVDGVVYNASLDLSVFSGTQSRFPITGLNPGAHRIVVTVVSGSVTFRGAHYLPCMGHRIPYNSPLITYTGTWSVASVDSAQFDRLSEITSTTSDTATVTFVGTGLAFSGLIYSAVNSIGVTVDGGTESVQSWSSSGTSAQPGGRLVVSGLSYGRHTVVIRQASAGRSLQISHFFAFDETRTARPTRLAGLAVVGDVVDFGNSLPAVPAVQLGADDSTSTAPGYPTSISVAGFTVNGTSAARHAWTAESGRHAF